MGEFREGRVRGARPPVSRGEQRASGGADRSSHSEALEPRSRSGRHAGSPKAPARSSPVRPGPARPPYSGAPWSAAPGAPRAERQRRRPSNASPQRPASLGLPWRPGAWRRRGQEDGERVGPKVARKCGRARAPERRRGHPASSQPRTPPLRGLVGRPRGTALRRPPRWALWGPRASS